MLTCWDNSYQDFARQNRITYNKNLKYIYFPLDFTRKTYSVEMYSKSPLLPTTNAANLLKEPSVSTIKLKCDFRIRYVQFRATFFERLTLLRFDNTSALATEGAHIRIWGIPFLESVFFFFFFLYLSSFFVVFFSFVDPPCHCCAVSTKR